ncbi:MAG: nucleoside deaminase [Rickettsia endosymbiont of Bryobia graminum]|nr:nucleoside deaminase [Rickettsia endosymbiont of Bryobia graminum]
MQEALKQAQIANDQDEIPVGVVIVDRTANKIIVRSHNMVEQRSNSLLHAEIVAINKASEILSQKNLQNHDIYVTLEPCMMCAAAISFSRISRLFYAASDPKQGGVEHGESFFSSKSCFHRPEIYSDILSDCAEKLMKNFFKKIRRASKTS